MSCGKYVEGVSEHGEHYCADCGMPGEYDFICLQRCHDANKCLWISKITLDKTERGK